MSALIFLRTRRGCLYPRYCGRHFPETDPQLRRLSRHEDLVRLSHQRKPARCHPQQQRHEYVIALSPSLVRRRPIYHQISKAPPPFRLRRERAIKKFTAFIEKQYGEQYQVRVFGSTCYGASSGGLSDIDITIFVSVSAS